MFHLLLVPVVEYSGILNCQSAQKLAAKEVTWNKFDAKELSYFRSLVATLQIVSRKVCVQRSVETTLTIRHTPHIRFTIGVFPLGISHITILA